MTSGVLAMSLYQEACKAGLQMDSHYSDLYLLRTPTAIRLCQEHAAHWSTFTSQIDGKPWLDVPFAYEPYWAAKQSRHHVIA
jgi:hypothetical protein